MVNKDCEAFGLSMSAPNSQTTYLRYTKRILDILIVLAAAPMAWLLVLVSAFLVMRESRGNPFYFQERIGLNGKVFRIAKIRTMVPDAESVLEKYLDANPDAREEWDQTQKLQNDPRIIPIGRFLRRSSLDELPQLWNVLIGDMSIVGPRPMLVCQRDLYPGQAYYSLRPGITGPWQVSARNGVGFASRAKFDNAYLESVSMGLDLVLLWRTAGVMLRGTGV